MMMVKAVAGWSSMGNHYVIGYTYGMMNTEYNASK